MCSHYTMPLRAWESVVKALVVMLMLMFMFIDLTSDTRSSMRPVYVTPNQSLSRHSVVPELIDFAQNAEHPLASGVQCV